MTDCGFPIKTFGNDILRESGAVLLEPAGVGENQGHQIYGPECAELPPAAVVLPEALGPPSPRVLRAYEDRHRMPAMGFHCRRRRMVPRYYNHVRLQGRDFGNEAVELF